MIHRHTSNALNKTFMESEGILNLKFFFMESISIIKGATSVKKEAAKVQRQKSFFFLHKYHMPLFSAMVPLSERNTNPQVRIHHQCT